MRWGRAAAGAGLVGAGIAGWVAAARRDGRDLDTDPDNHILTRPVVGRPDVVATPDGVRLHVEIAGPDTAPTVVFAHGWGMTRRFWHYQLRDLRHDHRVVVYDQRGHGDSGPSPQADYSLAALGSDLDAVLRACVPDGERAVVVGHSLGGMGILAWARDHAGQVSDRLAGAVLTNTSGERITTALFAGVAATQRLGDALNRALLTTRLPTPARSTPLTRRLVRAAALGPDSAPAHVALTEEMFFDCPADVRSGFGVAISEVDLAGAAAHLDVPTVVVAGLRDRLVPPDCCRRLAQRLPDAELLELVRTGHQAPLERHEAVSDVVRDLARRQQGAAHTSGPRPSR